MANGFDTARVAVTDQRTDREPGIPGAEHGREIKVIVSAIPVVALTVIWTIVTRHAWMLRSIIQDYQAVHGEARVLSSPWPEHLQTLHDDLLAVGADYFYPFASGVIVVVAIAWIAGVAVLRTDARGVRRSLAGLGVLVLLTQLVLFASPLATYVTITD